MNLLRPKHILLGYMDPEALNTYRTLKSRNPYSSLEGALKGALFGHMDR